MMPDTYASVRAKWAARCADPCAARGLVPLGELASEVIADLEVCQKAADDADMLTVEQAHALGGYSCDHLRRMLGEGKIKNVGQKGRPRIRRADVPRKPGHTLRAGTEHAHIASRRRIALAVTDSQPRSA